MGPPRTTGVCICRQDKGAVRPGDPQQPTSGAHAGEPAGNAHPPPSATLDEDTTSSAAADAGLDIGAPPAASSETADTTEEAPCPQAIHQPGVGTCDVQAMGGTGRTDAGDKGPHAQPTVFWLYCTRNGEREPPAAPTHCNPGARKNVYIPVRPLARREWERTTIYCRGPETEDIVASIFNEVAPTVAQGLQTDEHIHHDESSAAFMASFRDRAPTTGPATTSALWHTAQNMGGH